MDDPSAALTAPVAEDLFPGGVDFFLHIGDLISLGHWAILAIDKMGGPNIAEEIGEWFAGDWSEVMKSKDALDNLAAFCDRASYGVDAELTTLTSGWSGEAATAAATYFSHLADQLDVQASNFRDIANQYQGTAFGVKELANAVGSLVESLVDYAIMAGVSLAAAAASSWTIVGGIAGGASAGYAIVRGAKVVAEILEIRAKVWTACEALLGLIAGFLSSIEGFTSVALPNAYDNTSVP